MSHFLGAAVDSRVLGGILLMDPIDEVFTILKKLRFLFDLAQIWPETEKCPKAQPLLTSLRGFSVNQSFFVVK
jgi:hypothetical protein